MSDNFDYSTMQTGDIVVSACQELLEQNEAQQELWGYVLRIENNSNERIRLVTKNLCITDAAGNCHHQPDFGFNGELPDLEPGECFEYEDTAQLNGTAAVIYGYCKAITTKGKELNIKLPILNLSSSKNVSAFLC